MRRSAAPSYQASAKRLKFISAYHNSNDKFEKENGFLEFSESNTIDSNENDLTLCQNSVSYNEDKLSGEIENEESGENILRSSDEILRLISEPFINTSGQISHSKSIPNNIVSNSSSQSRLVKKIFQPQTFPKPVNHTFNDYKKKVPENETKPSGPECAADGHQYYNVMYCKRTAKKHKIWEGDGVLIVKSRTAILKDMDGKIVDRGSGYKLKEIEFLEEGSKFYIGGKECEIQNVMSPEECTKSTFLNPGNSEPSPPDCFNNAPTCM